MCGIAGWADFTENLLNNTKIIDNMTDTLKLRGPDSSGTYITENVLLGHRRLVVVDPEGGKQPMIKTVEGREYIIVYNGELYNTEELRTELAAEGFKFESYSDTEVLLTSYICWGADLTKKLNGIFAFAIYDKANRQIFLARDPLGVKPLFYTIKGSSFIFGSEIKTLLAHPLVKPIIDKDGLTELFALGPASIPGSGTYKGIKELPPAYCMTVTSEQIRTYEYWKPTPEENHETPEQATEHLRSLLIDAVRRQLVGDVPLCTFLSGGLDSSAISAIAATEFKKQGKQLTTYSIDYEDNDKYFKKSLFQPTADQFYALIMKDFIGSNHITTVENHYELAKKLYEAVKAKDLPGMGDVDSSLYIFCKEIRKDFVIALSGECADEIFGGYPWFTRPEMLYADTFPWSRFVEDRKAILSKQLAGLKLSELTQQCYHDTLRQTPHLDNEDALTHRMREMFYLNIKWFMVNLLNRKDRMSMSNSLEVRVPFADYRLVQYAFNLPPDLKFLDGREKGLLRQSLKGILPQKIVDRKKSPYPKTHNPIYTDFVCNMMIDILNNKNAPVLQLVDKKKITELVETRGEAYKVPWFGQLMTGPQLIAYLIQMNIWLTEYDVKVEI
jgi:asparagine synthase (glutamine-hydrolysing)